MNINNVTVSEIVTLITVLGVISGFVFKIFSFFNMVNRTQDEIKKINVRIDFIENDRKIEKDQLIEKVEQTNTAVNLIYLAVSALIDDSISNNMESKDRLKEIKKELDGNKGII